MKEKIKSLKDLLISSEDFQATFGYFYTNLVSDSDFMNMGKALEKAPIISTTVTKTMQSLYKRMLETSKVKSRSNEETMAFVGVNYLEEFGFYHGAIQITNGMGSYLYFEKEGMGLLNIKFSESTQFWFSRFTAIPEIGDAIPMFYNHDPKNKN